MTLGERDYISFVFLISSRSNYNHLLDRLMNVWTSLMTTGRSPINSRPDAGGGGGETVAPPVPVID